MLDHKSFISSWLVCIEKIISTLLFPYFSSLTMDVYCTINRELLEGIWQDERYERNAKSRDHDCRSSSSSGSIPKAVISICVVSSSKLNARHFGNRLRGYKVVWGRKRRERPKEYFIFGTIQEEICVIRINPWLDQRFVPLWFLEDILYHEMLHAVVPDKVRGNGRRCVHTDEFNRREREFRF